MSTSTLRDNKAFEVNPILVINPSTLKRLVKADTSFIRIPNYGTPTSRTRSGRLKDLSWLRDKLSFLGFCRDVTQTNAARNGKPGFVVGRKLMEAAWAQLLVMTLVKQMDVGVDFYELREVFLVCLLQRHSEGVLGVWLNLRAKYPSLDTVTEFDELSTDISSDLVEIEEFINIESNARQAEAKALADFSTMKDALDGVVVGDTEMEAKIEAAKMDHLIWLLVGWERADVEMN